MPLCAALYEYGTSMLLPPELQMGRQALLSEAALQLAEEVLPEWWQALLSPPQSLQVLQGLQQRGEEGMHPQALLPQRGQTLQEDPSLLRCRPAVLLHATLSQVLSDVLRPRVWSAPASLSGRGLPGLRCTTCRGRWLRALARGYPPAGVRRHRMCSERSGRGE